MVFDPGSVKAYGQWYRIFSATFVHLDAGHLLLNMLLIALIGREVERAYGWVVILALIIACSIGGALFIWWMQPLSAVGGASTFGYGLFAMLILLSTSRGQGLAGPAVLLGVNLLYSIMMTNVSLWGHIGGLAGGALVALVLRVRGVRPRGFIG
ncbi:rhomboid family intramembrane serine protease [uncultured Corynebacterium sp.]|uniref:rhomboid family intramembrane serine protease n=1 Tax=uncultured Corynebacterium sp. TaxID=159447 RepID=UPI0025D2E063|nr:rhomboid family intramembrane serine protease [uncultured Corynebacterium sp.]